MTGLDAYDPSRENDLDAMESSTATGFGFKDEEVTTDTTTTSSDEAADSAKAQLLKMIQNKYK